MFFAIRVAAENVYVYLFFVVPAMDPVHTHWAGVPRKELLKKHISEGLSTKNDEVEVFESS